MMDRRQFGSLLAGIALVAGASAQAAGPRGRPKRTFRKDGAGAYREVRKQDVRKGDEVVTLGLDEAAGELWCLHLFTADSDYVPPGATEWAGDHGGVLVKEGTFQSLKVG